MAEIADPPLKTERQSNADSMGKWMTGLRDALPNPTLTQGNEPPAEPPDEPPAQPPGDAPAAPPATPPAQPAPIVPAAPPAEPAALGEERWPRSAKEWKNFTTAKKAKDQEYEKAITAKDAKIKELEALTGAGQLPPEVQKQVETLKKENDEYSKQLRLLAVTTHPKFKNYFDTKINNTLAQLKSCVSADKIDAVTKLVLAPEGEGKDLQVEALMDEMTGLQRGRFVGVINNLSAIQAEREGEVARAQQDYEQIQAQAKAEQDQKRGTFARMLDDTLKGMQDAAKGRPEYQLREGENEWNASVQRRIESGKKLITGQLPPDVMFKAAFDAAAYPDVLAGYKAALTEVDRLKKQLGAMTAANPRVQGSQRTDANGNGPAAPVLKKDMRAMDYTAGWVKRFGEALRGDQG